MEIESRSDLVTLTLPRETAAALADAGEAGFRLIEALHLVGRPGSTDAALRKLRDQVGRGRGKTVDIELTRGDAKLAEHAVDVGLRGLRALLQPEPEGAESALVKLRTAIRVADTPDPSQFVVERPRRRR